MMWHSRSAPARARAHAWRWEPPLRARARSAVMSERAVPWRAGTEGEWQGRGAGGAALRAAPHLHRRNVARYHGLVVVVGSRRDHNVCL
eukprot:scaffold40099_cov65-Phaeocystis_antarctica.AAC.1